MRSLAANPQAAGQNDEEEQIPVPGRLNQRQLAKRLRCGPDAIRNHRDGILKTTLEEWSAGVDPDGVSWRHLPGVTDKSGFANYYVPVDWVDQEGEEQPGKQQAA